MADAVVAPGDAPGILYGTAWKGDRTAALVERAIVLGFRGVDTACQPKHYDEAGVGRGVAAALVGGTRSPRRVSTNVKEGPSAECPIGPGSTRSSSAAGCGEPGTNLGHEVLARAIERSELYLQTKFTPLGGQDPRRVPYDARARVAVQIEQSCRLSLQNLGTTYLDALLLHSPISPFDRMREAWQAFEAQVDAGVVRALGISNCYDPHLLATLWQAARIKPTVVQNRFYRETGYDRTIREFCLRHGVRYQSFWTLSANPHLLAHREIAALAARYAATPAQILFRYLTQVGVTPLSGTTSELHMQQDLAIFDLTLTDLELSRISALLE